MIKRILIILGIFMLLSLIGLWLISGGPGKVSFSASKLSNPIDYLFGKSSTGEMNLPWQIPIPQGPDITGFAAEESDYSTDDISGMQEQTDEVQRQINEAKTFGDPSPYRGKISFSGRDSGDGSPEQEYVIVHASGNNNTPVVITGWSIQSIHTGARFYINRAAPLFVGGSVNPTAAVALNPGADAIVSSGHSPLGVSFRENICSGYLAQFQNFYPDIEQQCPEPTAALPETPENLQRYRASCFDYVQGMPSCHFPGSSLPQDLDGACQSFVTNTYTYNGCVNMYQARTNFRLDQWRLYLGSDRKLWDSSHDIIRLLDSEGRTVDVMTY